MARLRCVGNLCRSRVFIVAGALQGTVAGKSFVVCAGLGCEDQASPDNA
jgi:hypothetical protein